MRFANTFGQSPHLKNSWASTSIFAGKNDEDVRALLKDDPLKVHVLYDSR
jgi:hypothetical protein